LVRTGGVSEQAISWARGPVRRSGVVKFRAPEGLA
jgi:hypothetical protein